MSRRVVWFLAGSRAPSFLDGFDGEFRLCPVSADDLPQRDEDDGALVVDLAGGDAPADAQALACHLAVPVVAVIDPAATPPGALACDAFVTAPPSPALLAHAVRAACDHARLRREHDHRQGLLEGLNAIGVRLTAERDTDALLALVLTTARQITRSDAGSLYLVETGEDGTRRLRFKLAQNDSVPIAFDEFTLDLDQRSIAGHVALTGDLVALDDAYVVPEGYRFRINRDFDAHARYRTRSMLVVAMRTPAGEIIGVLQLINCKRNPARRLTSPALAAAETVPYAPEYQDVAASLASQAAVAVENSRLYGSIQSLFEGFVSASVTAIEARDPATSGHSFRVADLATAVAEAVDRVDDGPLRVVRFTSDAMRELRYAALLHDFGKVGVREEVLVKAKKLHPWHVELLRQRGELIKRGLELKYARRAMRALLARRHDELASTSAAWEAELAAEMAEVDRQLKMIETANEPALLPDGSIEDLAALTLPTFDDGRGEPVALLTADEARVLSIARGSLTPEEYRDIQSHVVHTFQFLRQIPWTRELRRVPAIARAHHEKLDGSGYPDGMRGDAIPLASRILTIVDIFDALTATDRPYKPAVPVEHALDILHHQARSGKLDPRLLDVFVATQPWRQSR
jgi:HD-GYP domain-containing protein (c-di-GMP phosphodiesterase class II)